MSPLLRYLIALPLLWVSAQSASTPDDWRLEKDEDGIRIASRAVEGWDIREMRGQTTVPGPLASLVAVVDDASALPELNDFVVSTTVQNRQSATRYQMYSLTRMPWPLKDRDIVVQREIVQDPATLAVTVTDTAIQGGVPEKKGLVRIQRSRQQWMFTPAADGSVAVELRMLSDPNGPIPSSLLNSMSVSTPFKSIAKLRKLARSPKYAGARPDFIRDTAGRS
ncbi:MAG: START domain-containing protein [Panacagrimonas sp.]